MVFGRKKTVLPPRIYEFRRRYLELEPLEVGASVREYLFEMVKRVGVRRIIDAYQALSEARSLFPFNGTIVGAADILDYIVTMYESGEAATPLDDVLDMLLEILRRLDRESLSEAGSLVSHEVLPDSRVFLASPSLVTYRVALGVRAKASIVRLPVYYPLNGGIRYAESLHREGVKVMHVPDYLRAQAMERTDVVIAPFYAVTRDGLLVTDPGAGTVVRLAWARERTVYMVGVRSSLAKTIPSEDLLRESEGIIGRKTRVLLADLVDPDEGEVRIALRGSVRSVDRDSILSEAEWEAKSLRDIVERLASGRAIG